jgi:carbamoylphosphate synthase large subunit
VTGPDESLARAETLLAKLEATRAELERLAGAEGDAEKALEVLGELSELAKEVEEALEQARRASETGASETGASETGASETGAGEAGADG